MDQRSQIHCLMAMLVIEGLGMANVEPIVVSQQPWSDSLENNRVSEDTQLLLRDLFQDNQTPSGHFVYGNS